MFKINKYTQLGVFLLSALPTASFAMKYKSFYQEQSIPFYVALGGGWGLQIAEDFDLQTPIDGLVTSINQPNDETSDIGIGYGAIGYILPNNPFRLEVAYNYWGQGDYNWNELVHEPVFPGRSVDADASVFSHTVMLNGYFDIIYDERWIPFIVAGVGYGLNVSKFHYDVELPAPHPVGDIERNSDTEFTSNFVWQAGAGLSYAVSEQFSASMQVTYTSLGETVFDAKKLAENDSDNVDFLELDNLMVVAFTANIAYHF